jgi:hypothetical protein
MTRDRSKAAIRIRIEARRRIAGVMARPWIPAFISLIANGVRVSDAAVRLGLARSTIYAARIADPRFATRWDAAARAACPVVSRAETIAALCEGEAVPVFYRGKQIGVRRVHAKAGAIIRRLRIATRGLAKEVNGSPPPENDLTQFRPYGASTLSNGSDPQRRGKATPSVDAALAGRACARAK